MADKGKKKPAKRPAARGKGPAARTPAAKGGGAGPAEPAVDAAPSSSVQPVQLRDEMERSFIDYAMSVIMSRALPDVRDGLKPVHRRIIWDMDQQGFRPDRPFVKCARITGDTMARYHPHGDLAIYDALVRMAQPFSLRHPLIDFHGNYGSPDFGPAASRYTEARLHPLSMQLLDGIDEDTVDLVANYDGTAEEPTVLPARFPNLLVNGSQGIAVGMATSIPPHNLGEIIDATLHLLAHPTASVADLMKMVKGPDFPTGGLILGRAGITDAYTTGRGSITMRAKLELEEGARGQTRIVVTELPYQAACSAIAAQIQALVDGGKLEGISDVNDNSAGGDTNLVITLKRDANAQVVLNRLYKNTKLETMFPVNMVALVDGVPRTLTLKDAIAGYVAHQIDVVTRRSQHRLARAKDRLHILEGRLKAINVIDDVIKTIRASEDAAAAKTALMGKKFGFSERQAIDILDMQLRQLTRLSRIDLETEQADVERRVKELTAILADDATLRGVIAAELGAVRAAFATPRVCTIAGEAEEIAEEDLHEDKDLVVVMTQAQYIKAVPAASFRAQSRGGKGVTGAKVKDADIVRTVVATTAHSYLLFFTNLGRVYRRRALQIPERDRTAKGIPVVNLIKQLRSGEKIQAIIPTQKFPGERFLFFVTRNGTVKKTAFTEFDETRDGGLLALRLKSGDELVRVVETHGDDDIVLVTRGGLALRFSETEVRAMGRDAAGMRGMKIRDDDAVVAVDTSRAGTHLLTVTESGYGKRTPLEEYSTKGRGGLGMIAMKLTGKKGQVVAGHVVSDGMEIVAVGAKGATIRMPVADITEQGRAATGVRIMRAGADQAVTSVATLLPGDED
ncbi:MAG: gyrase subunit [Actinomycetota bacterium]